MDRYSINNNVISKFNTKLDREICHFDREITAKLTILQFRGTAKFGEKKRDKYRPLFEGGLKCTILEF